MCETAPDYAGEALGEVRDIASEFHMTDETEWRDGRPAQVVVHHIEDNDLDHVVMGSHGRSGIERVFLGSVAETTLRRSSIPVTIVKEE